MNKIETVSRARGTLLLCLGAACISFSPLFVTWVQAGPKVSAFYRMLWGGLALVLLAALKGQRLVPAKSLLPNMTLAAVFFSADLVCWHQSILYIGPGLATILGNFQVFFMALFGALALKERLGPRLKIAIPLAVIGLLLLVEADPRELPPHVSTGLLLGLCTGLFYTGYLLNLRRSQLLPERLPALANMGLVSLCTAALLAVISVSMDESLIVPDPRSNLLLLIYGAGCQGLGWYLISSGLPLVPASRAGLIILIQPALSFVWDIIFLNRQTGVIGYLGAALALGAICLGSLGNSGENKEKTK